MLGLGFRAKMGIRYVSTLRQGLSQSVRPATYDLPYMTAYIPLSISMSYNPTLFGLRALLCKT